MAKPVKHLIIVLFISLLMLSAGTGSAQAATKNGVNRVVSVKQDYAGYPRTDLTIAEDEALYDGIQAGESFELLLPPGVEWAVDASGVATYHSEDIICQNCAVGARLINARTVEITITAADPDAPARLTIPLVFAVEDYLGDIEVTIDSLDSGISGGNMCLPGFPIKKCRCPSLILSPNRTTTNGAAGGVHHWQPFSALMVQYSRRWTLSLISGWAHLPAGALCSLQPGHR